MRLTLTEKIATRFAVGLPAGQPARRGDFITIRPRHVMTHDNTAAVIPKWKEMTGPGGAIADPSQPVFAIDHDIQNTTPENLGKYARIEQFAREHNIDFYPAGTGISHQVMVEQGYVVPGCMVVGSDSHSNLYGALAALGTPVVRTDAAGIWATGTTWWQVPPVARVELRGKLRSGVVGKDVIIALCGAFNHDEVLNHAVEFSGDGVACLTVDQRMSIANMTTEWGALAGVFPFDEVLRDWLMARADYFARAKRPGVQRHLSDNRGIFSRADVDAWWHQRIGADADAEYSVELALDLGSIVPHVSGPNDVKTMVSVPVIEKQRIRINKAWLMSCVNARYEDLAEAARIVRGRKVAEGVEFYVAAASAEVQERAVRDGHWGALMSAGAIELPPGCGTCIGLGRGTIKAGEVGISSTNRNFEGRMGDRNGLVYLGSPAVVAASAIAGYLCAPERFEDAPLIALRKSNGASAADARGDGSARREVTILEGFPHTVRGRLLFLDRDNLNTDGIYAGKWTYKEGMTPAEMAAVCFENYDPAFGSMHRAGDIVVSGRNFGTGSSREQAATALKHRGVPCVIAASFSETYKRNAFNNGFVVFECPDLVDWLRDRPGRVARPEEQRPKTDVAGEIRIDYRRGKLEVTPAWGGQPKEFAFSALSPVAQELVVAGGAEEVVKRKLGASRGVA